MDAKFILNVLKDSLDPLKFAFFDELRIGGGFGKDSEQRFDAWSICYYPSKRNVTTCYEIKISKSDFLHEIKNPKKRRAGLRLSNEFYFVTPEDLLKITDIPVECGLKEVTESGKIKTIIPAPFRDIEPPTWLFLSSVCRRNLKISEGYSIEDQENHLRKLKSDIITKLQLMHTEWNNKRNELITREINKALDYVMNIELTEYLTSKDKS
jgi:hypothetical protein